MMDLSLLDDETGEAVEDTTSTALIDLFGCGFIAAIFLFLLFAGVDRGNRAAAAHPASSGGAGWSSNGPGGPIVIEFAVPKEAQVSSWVAKFGAKATDSLTPGFKEYVIVLPNAARVQWPLLLSASWPPAIVTSAMNREAVKARMRVGPSGAAVTVPMNLLTGQLRLRLNAAPELEIQVPGVVGTRVEMRAPGALGQRQRSLRFLGPAQTCRAQWLMNPPRRYQLLVRSSGPEHRSESRWCPEGEGFATLTFNVQNPEATSKCVLQKGRPPAEFLENPAGILVACP